jgi:mitofusin
LEEALRSFVLLKRSTSKLLPAKNYLLKLHKDMQVLIEHNVDVAAKQFDEATEQLEQIKPVYERLTQAKDQVSEAVAKVEEAKIEQIKNVVWSRLDKALAYINKGQLVPASPNAPTSTGSELPFAIPTSLPDYPGVLGIWQWAAEVKEAFLQSLEGEVRKAEEAARAATIQGHDEILNGLGDRFLPENSDNTMGRVFAPEVMFSKRRAKLALLQRRVGVGAVGLGQGTFGKVDVSILDLFDLERLNPFNAASKSVTEDVEAAGALSVVSLGVGAITMFGSRAVGVRGFVEAVARVADILGSPHARKWAGPVIGVLSGWL